MRTRDSYGIGLAAVLLFIGAMIAGVPGKAGAAAPHPGEHAPVVVTAPR